jgi:hypothetical protein
MKQRQPRYWRLPVRRYRLLHRQKMTDSAAHPPQALTESSTRAVERELPQALSFLSITTSAFLVMSAAFFVSFTGRVAAGVPIAVAAIALPLWIRRWSDQPRDRREALLLGAVSGMVGLTLIGAVGRSGIPLLLVPATLCSGFDFGHWRFSDDAIALRDLKQRTARLDGSLIALGPAYLGDAILIASGKGTGTAVVGLIAAPWLYSAPAVTIFLRSWPSVANEQSLAMRRTVAFFVKRRLHSRVVVATRHLAAALDIACTREVDAMLIEQLRLAARRCAQAQDRAFLVRHFDDELSI